MPSSAMTSKGQLTLPKAIRERLLVRQAVERGNWSTGLWTGETGSS